MAKKALNQELITKAKNCFLAEDFKGLNALINPDENTREESLFIYMLMCQARIKLLRKVLATHLKSIEITLGFLQESSDLFLEVFKDEDASEKRKKWIF